MVINSIINGAAGAAFYTNILNTIFNNCIAINSTVAGFSIDAGAIGAILKLCTAMNNDIGLLINATAENVEVVDSTINNNTSVDIEDNSTSSNITNVNINTVQHMFSSNVVTTFNQSNFNVTGVTITVPGTYIVEQDITSVASGFVITIESNDVILDLGGQTINGGAISGGIVVNNVSNVTIRNGNIINTSDNSIQINNCSGTVINNINTDGITTINTTSIAVNNSTSTVIENTNVNNNSGGSGYSISNSSDTTIQNSSGCGSSSSSSSFPFGIISSVLSDATSILDSVLCSKPSFPFPEIGIAAEGGAGLIVNNVQIFNAAGGVVVEGVAGVVISNVVGTGIGAVGGIVAGAGAVDVVVINSIINGAAGAAFYTNILNTIFNNCTAINSTVAGFSIDAGAIGAILKLCTAMNNDIGLLINATAENVEVVDSTINNNTSVDIEDNSTSSNITNVNINTVQHMFSSNVVTTFNQSNFNVTGVTITVPGTYIVEQDITSVASGFVITIESNDVILDLGGQTINGGAISGGIVVNNVSNVTIRNGNIINTSDNSIQINNCSGTVINNINTDGITTINTTSIAVNNSTSTVIENTNVNNNSGGSGYSISNSSDTTIQNSSGCGSSSSSSSFPFGIISSVLSDATSILDSVLCSKPSFPFPEIGIAAEGGAGLIVNNVQIFNAAGGVVVEGVAGVVISNVVGTGIGAVGGIVAGAGAVDVVVINSIINGAAGAAFYTNILNTIFNNCTAINSTVAGFSIDAGAIGVILKLCTAMNNDIGLLINATAENVEVVDSTINNNISVDIEDNSTSSNITNVNINTVQHMFSSNVVTTFDQTNFNVAGQTIIAPGTYILEQDVIFSAGGFAITIDSDDVTLDLGGQTIDCDGTGGGVMVTDQSNVTIRHGSIVNTGTNAIQVNDGSNTLIDDITISGMMALNTDSIQINGSDETTIQNTNVDNENAGPAVAVKDSQNTNIENIVARGDIGGGVGGGGIVSVDTSDAINILDSLISELGLAHILIGAAIQSGNGVQVIDCGMLGTVCGLLMNNLNNVNLARIKIAEIGSVGGIVADNVTNMVAEGNVMQDIEGPGIALQSSSSVLSKNNQVSGASGDAFVDTLSTDIVHDGDQAMSPVGNGFMLTEVTQGNLIGCNVVDAGGIGFSIGTGSTDIVIKNCSSNGAGGNGFDVAGVLGTPLTGISVVNSFAQNSTGDGFVTNFVDNITFECDSATENGGDGFDIINTNNALLCNCLTHENSGAADVFIDATSNNTSIYEGCIEFGNIVDNGTNTSIFLEKSAFNKLFVLLKFCCQTAPSSECVCTL